MWYQYRHGNRKNFDRIFVSCTDADQCHMHFDHWQSMPLPLLLHFARPVRRAGPGSFVPMNRWMNRLFGLYWRLIKPNRIVMICFRFRNLVHRYRRWYQPLCRILMLSNLLCQMYWCWVPSLSACVRLCSCVLPLSGAPIRLQCHAKPPRHQRSLLKSQ